MLSFSLTLTVGPAHLVALAYVAAAWHLIQVLETLFPIFGLSENSIRAVVIILAVGFTADSIPARGRVMLARRRKGILTRTGPNTRDLHGRALTQKQPTQNGAAVQIQKDTLPGMQIDTNQPIVPLVAGATDGSFERSVRSDSSSTDTYTDTLTTNKHSEPAGPKLVKATSLL